MKGAANGGGLLGSDREVADNAVKIPAARGFDNLKTSGDAVRSHNPRLGISHRKLGNADLSALGTNKIFNPTVAFGHPVRMPRIPKSSNVIWAALRENQTWTPKPLRIETGPVPGQHGNSLAIPEPILSTAHADRLNVRSGSKGEILAPSK
jgi:hypothetical protein